MATLKTTCWGDTYTVEMDESQAASGVLFDGEITPHQTATFRHNIEAALREHLTSSAREGGAYPHDADEGCTCEGECETERVEREIEEAVERAKFVSGRDLAAIEQAYQDGAGKWIDCDWEYRFDATTYWGDEEHNLSISALATLDTSPVAGYEGNEAAAYRLTLDHFSLDEDETEKLDAEQRHVFEMFVELVESREKYLNEVRRDAEQAQGYADDALAYAQECDLEAAREAAEEACRLEQHYGDCPTWRALREAIEEAVAEN